MSNLLVSSPAHSMSRESLNPAFPLNGPPSSASLSPDTSPTRATRYPSGPDKSGPKISPPTQPGMGQPLCCLCFGGAGRALFGDILSLSINEVSHSLLTHEVGMTT